MIFIFPILNQKYRLSGEVFVTRFSDFDVNLHLRQFVLR